jgi:hypothetical protein
MLVQYADLVDAAHHAAHLRDRRPGKLVVRIERFQPALNIERFDVLQLEAAASERGLTPSEWFRETLLASVNGREPKASDPGGTGHAVMAELVALRAILLNVLFKLANGQNLTAEEMQRLIDRADSDKLSKARERLLQAQESEGQRKEKS